MVEGAVPARRREIAPAIVPEPIGAVFAQGEVRSIVYDWPSQDYLKPSLDVLDSQARKRWAFLNIRAFDQSTDAHLVWKGAINFWLRDLNSAAEAERENVDREDRREMKKKIGETKKEVMAMMAVSASARAMEASAGDVNDYVSSMGGEKGMGVQGPWREFLVHNNPDSYNRVIEMPLVGRYYKRLCRDAGLTGVQEWEGGKPRTFGISRARARNSKLVEYLRTKGGGDYKGGFDEYIADFLLEGDSPDDILILAEEGFDDSSRWVAARLACDAFLIDKFTEYEYVLDPERKLELRPSSNWDGDPLRATLQPSFLPRVIKGRYPGEQGVILNILDKAFRPDDIFEKEEIKDKMVQPSMVGHLKALKRWSDALWLAFGESTQAAGLSQWDKDTCSTIKDIVDLLDQVYGAIDTPKKPDMGKRIEAAMVARLIQAKGLAYAVEVSESGFSDRVRTIFETDERNPFAQIILDIWGPGAKARRGLLAELAGGARGLVFKGNEHRAVETLNDAYKLLLTAEEKLSPRDSLARTKRIAEKLINWGKVAAAIQEVFT